MSSRSTGHSIQRRERRGLVLATFCTSLSIHTVDIGYTRPEEFGPFIEQWSTGNCSTGTRMSVPGG